MKTQCSSMPHLRPLAWLTLTALTLIGSVPRVLAADSTVTLGAGEFQRMVYSAHLLTQLEAKPELDASLLTLLELQRRNPQADPFALADVVREALARYRANAPAYIRTNGFRDEILAAYPECFLQVPQAYEFPFRQPEPPSVAHHPPEHAVRRESAGVPDQRGPSAVVRRPGCDGSA
jgi:hypothetical protein